VSFASVVERLQTLENPYPGLRPFETQESHLFFGRDLQVAELVGRLERNRFVAVLGVSGSGKSSLVRAGLIPALERSRVSEAGRRWRMVITRPAGAPFERLAEELSKAGFDPAALEESSHGLIEVARQLPPDESLLVVVDQFEELFRYKDLPSMSEDARRRHDTLAADAAEFVQLLLAASRHQPPVYIVLTMRSDYLGDCAEFRDLPETLNDCQYLVPRMMREQRKEAIERPLGRVEIAPTLVQRLLNDAGDEPDQLPVLQHALMRTWSHWRTTDPDGKRRIEVQDYEAIGGLGGALNQHADDLLAGVPADIAATIFKRLTARGRSSRERRNPALLSELWAVCGADTPERQAEVTAVVEHFRRGEATFLTPRNGAIDGNTYIDITHESLIRQWRKLRDEWLPDEQKSAKTFQDLVDRAGNWSERKGELLIGLDLSDALEWDRERNKTSAWAKHYADESALKNVLAFIGASELQQREQVDRRKRERRRLGLAMGAAGLAVVTGLVVVVWVQAAAARDAREAAFKARILSVPSMRDPLARALLLAEMADHANDEEESTYLPIYQQAAAAAIPYAVFRYRDTDVVLATGFRRDGRAAVVLANGTLWSWRSDGRGDGTMEPIGRPVDTTGPPPTLTAAAFSRDGRWIAAGLLSGDVWVTPSDTIAAGPSSTPDDTGRRTSQESVSALAFSRDGRQLAAAFNDFSVRVWKLDGTRQGVLRSAPIRLSGAHVGTILSIDFDPTGTQVTTGSVDGTTRIWNIESQNQRLIAQDDEGSPATCVAFSADGAWVLSGYASGVIRIRNSDPHGISESPPVPVHAAPLTSAAFSPDGSKLVTASADRTARVWLLRSGQGFGDREPAALALVGAPTILTHDAKVTATAFSEDGTRIVTASADATTRLWRSESGEPRILGVHDGRVESVAFSPDEKRVLSASDDHTARIWSIDGSSSPLVLAGHGDWVRSAAFSPVDPLKVVTASDDGTVRLWDLAVAGKSRVSQEGDRVFSAAFSGDGARLVTAVADETARIWMMQSLAAGDRYNTHEQSKILELRHEDWVLGAAFSKDGSKVVTASRDGAARIWEPNRSLRDPIKRFLHPQGTTVFSAAFSPNGSRIVTASADGVARVWKTESMEDLDLRHAQEVTRAIFNSKGNLILTASKDGTARIWSADDGSERLELQHGTESVRAIDVDALDTQVVTGTADGVVRLWRVKLSALKDYLSHASTACLTTRTRAQFLGESQADARSRYEACERRYERTPARDDRHTAAPTGTGQPSQ
jgi:WD40 repeat protein